MILTEREHLQEGVIRLWIKCILPDTAGENQESKEEADSCG